MPGGERRRALGRVRNGLVALRRAAARLRRAVYRSEAANNQRNAGIAHLLRGYGRMYCDPDEATEVYTRQCALGVTARDLATMGATLAGGGVNPVTGERVVSADTCRHVLAVMATSGLYEHSGDWLYDVGLPGKSGVSGGIVTVAPGKGALATYSPRLDNPGNSVRGRLARATCRSGSDSTCSPRRRPRLDRADLSAGSATRARRTWLRRRSSEG